MASTQIAAPVTNAPPSLLRSLVHGTSSLGAAVTIERGLVFISNLLVARLGGAHIMGAYSLAMTTANNVASYAGAGIGTTANRFSGQYSRNSGAYRKLLRTLTLVSVQSALFAAGLLWMGASPVATHLLSNPNLTRLLKLASLSAGSIILLECFRGFLIGQRKSAALLSLSLMAGGAMLVFMPLAALRGPETMVLAQATIAVAAVTVCIAFGRGLGIAPLTTQASAAGPDVRGVWHFGLIQLTGVIGLNAAGWWTASLVSRADLTLSQMGFYAIALQLRNLVAMAPGLVSQSNYALLADEAGDAYGGSAQVLRTCTSITALLALSIGGGAIAILPWLVHYLYGKSFEYAELAAALSIATALVHMGFSPAASRLTIVSLKLTGIINAIWAAFVIALGPVLIPLHGAVGATLIFLLGHMVSGVLVLLALRHHQTLPREVTRFSGLILTGAAALASLAWLRWLHVSSRIPLTVMIMLVLAALLLAALYWSRNLLGRSFETRSRTAVSLLSRFALSRQ